MKFFKEYRNHILTFLGVFLSVSVIAQNFPSKRIAILDDEYWWAGVVRDGDMMPFQENYSTDLYGNNVGNQIQPLLLSSKGRVIWSEDAISFQITPEYVEVTSRGSEIILSNSGQNLASAFRFASQNYFPPSRKIPDRKLFNAPQYNTWIEMIYDQNQEDILKYAHGIVSNGFEPGVLMIDDNWQEDYGKWNFHPGRFSDPVGMVDSLHGLGFKVMMWICPFVSPDCDVYRSLADKEYLIKEKETGDPYMVRWWNGVSAVLDLTNPGAIDWFDQELRRLQDSVGIDGFKFDAGDSYFYNQSMESFKPATPNDHTYSFQQFGLKYPLNEYRATWKMGGQPLAQRLHDKGHNWEDLQKLIPQIGLQGILGYPFNCPDMIGGGQFGSFIDLQAVDQELIVRSAQLHALMPMMQFSVAPWRVLDAEHLDAVKRAVEIRKEYMTVIMQLVEQAANTGEPVVKLMEYVFPGEGFEKVQDQFMLGDNLLVAPILVTGASSREVILPKGKWSYEGKIYKGGRTVSIAVALSDIPVFARID